MAIQQTGYRDPAKAMTIKALQDRQKAAQAATAATMGSVGTTVNADPLSAVGNIAQVLAGGLNENRAARQEGAARGQLAEIMAGIDPEKGATMQQIAAMQQLDPEFANKEYERAMAERAAVRAREDQQAFATGERVAGQEYGTTERVGAQQFTAGQQEDTQAAAAQLAADNDKRAAAEAVLADTRADQNAKDAAAAEIAQLDHQNEATVAENKRKEALPQVEQAQIIDAFNKGQFGDPASPEAIAQKDAALAKLNYVAPLKPADAFTPGQQEIDKKFAPEVIDWKTSGGANATKAITQVNKAIDILQTQGGTGVAAGIADAYLPEWMAKSGWVNRDMYVARDAVRETVQQTLRATLGSQFTEKEGADLMNRAFDVNQLPEENIRRAKILMAQVGTIAQQKQMMIDHFDKFGTISNYNGPPLDLSALINLDLGDKEPPADAGGGGTGAPVFDPAVDKEGDTGSDETGNWIVRNKQWVRQ